VEALSKKALSDLYHQKSIQAENKTNIQQFKILKRHLLLI